MTGATSHIQREGRFRSRHEHRAGEWRWRREPRSSRTPPGRTGTRRLASICHGGGQDGCVLTESQSEVWWCSGQVEPTSARWPRPNSSSMFPASSKIAHADPQHHDLFSSHSRRNAASHIILTASSQQASSTECQFLKDVFDNVTQTTAPPPVPTGHKDAGLLLTKLYSGSSVTVARSTRLLLLLEIWLPEHSDLLRANRPSRGNLSPASHVERNSPGHDSPPSFLQASLRV